MNPLGMVKQYLHGWTAVILIVVLAAAGTFLGGLARKVLWVAAVIVALCALYSEMTKK